MGTAGFPFWCQGVLVMMFLEPLEAWLQDHIPFRLIALYTCSKTSCYSDYIASLVSPGEQFLYTRTLPDSLIKPEEMFLLFLGFGSCWMGSGSKLRLCCLFEQLMSILYVSFLNLNCFANNVLPLGGAWCITLLKVPGDCVGRKGVSAW